MNSNAQKWVEALKSGEFKQTTGALHIVDVLEDGSQDSGYCCLGVACELFDRENPGVVDRTIEQAPNGRYVESFNGKDNVLPKVVQRWLGLKDDGGSYIAVDNEAETPALWKHNDGDLLDFGQIAAIIESGPTGLFEE